MLLNTDGSLPSTVDSIAYGGDLIRNSLDLCRVGFMANFGETSVLRAELWVILQGLQLSWDSGFPSVSMLLWRLKGYWKEIGVLMFIMSIKRQIFVPTSYQLWLLTVSNETQRF